MGLGSIFPYLARGAVTIEEFNDAVAKWKDAYMPKGMGMNMNPTDWATLSPERYEQLAMLTMNFAMRSKGTLFNPFCNIIFNMAFNYPDFSGGLGIGLGSVFKYLPNWFQKDVSKLSNDKGGEALAKGLKIGKGPSYRRGENSSL